MFFLDSTGVFSLICLLIQCGMAWIFAAFFAVLAAARAPWLRSWSGAYLGMGLGLTAIAVRFVLAHHHVAGDGTLREGQAGVRAFYAVYLAGKVLFAWCFLAGASRLRAAPWPRGGRWPIVAVSLGAVVGAAVPTVESLLFVQALVLPVVFLRAAQLLAPRAGDRPGWGRLVPRTLVLWSIVWWAYGASSLLAGLVHPLAQLPWTYLLRVNSLIDLTFQAVLATGLIVVVMSEAQRAVVAAIDERDRLRDRLRRDEKLQALATLVSGVAHEINNPLTSILGFAEDLASEQSLVRQRAAAVVREQAERCRAIVQRMSLVGRTGALAATHVDPAELVSRVVRGFLPQSQQLGVSLRTEVALGLPPLLADATACEQLLANLVANALQASPRGAEVRVAAALVDGGVELRVDDRGPGVPAADRARVFEPFFTTKPAGSGTGLGLAVVDAVVRAHGGRVEVGDASGGGASFVVWLPLGRAAAVDGRGEPSSAASRLAGAKRRLLVVDDEPLVRDVLVRQAEASGWRAVGLGSAADALEQLLQGCADVDAIVCDLRMPGMSGQQFHDQLARSAPHWLERIVFVTGDPASSDATAFARRCRAPIVGKPFVPRELLARVLELPRVAVG